MCIHLQQSPVIHAVQGAEHQLVNFACRGCPNPNKPFVPEQTSGIAAWMSEANSDSTGQHHTFTAT